MSAICGIIRFDGKKVDQEDIQKILNHVHYRVHDKHTVWFNNNIGLGSKLLYSTPESVSDTQPFFTQHESLYIVADARIDNRNELIQSFNLKNNDNNHISDTELILFAYQKWAEEIIM